MINQNSIQNQPLVEKQNQPKLISLPATEKSWKKKVRRAVMLAAVVKRWKKSEKPTKFSWQSIPKTSNFSKTLGHLDKDVEDHWFPVPEDELHLVRLLFELIFHT